MHNRLLSIINHTNLTINQFEDRIGAGNSAIRKVVDGNGGISTKNIEKIFRHFPEYNLDWLLTGRGEMLITGKSKPAKIDKPLDKSSVVTVDNTDNIVVPILDSRAAAGSPYILDEPDYYKELPTFSFPEFFFRSGVRIGIQVRGDSMHPTIKQGDYVIGRHIEDPTHLRNGEVYVIIYQEDQRLHFFVKRAYYFLGDETLLLRSDNDDYPDEQLPLHSIMKLYQVEAGYTTQFTRIESSRGRFDRIEKRIDRIEKSVVKN